MLMSLLMLCDSYRIQTCNLLIRSQMLYSVELRSHALVALRLQRYNVFLYYAIFFLIFFASHVFFIPDESFNAMSLLILKIIALLQINII